MNHDYKSYCQVSDLADSQGFLTRIRHQLHQNPELSFKELATAELVAAHLSEWGYDVTRNIGGHGLVGRLRQGDGGRSVALRADMDALPIMEENSSSHVSRNAGVMHACGHDGHTTMLLGAARQLASTRNFSGTVNLVFQPAEEAGRDSGAQRMIADGLFARFRATPSSACTITLAIRWAHSCSAAGRSCRPPTPSSSRSTVAAVTRRART